MAKFIKLTKGQTTIVSDEDYVYLCSLGKWCVQLKDNGSFYAVRTINYKHQDGHWTTRQLKMHDVIACRMFRDIPDGMEVDHVNRLTLDNTRENIRLCTRLQNQHNRRRQINKASGLPKGVFKDKGRNKYRARILFQGQKNQHWRIRYC